jgi:hypothetical protein
MIATGQDVQPVIEQIVGQLRRDSESAGRVFGIGDAQVDLFRIDDLFEILCDDTSSRRGENVTYEKKIGQRT